MQVENKTTPSVEQIKGFFELGSQGPIYMLNLVKFKDKAENPSSVLAIVCSTRIPTVDAAGMELTVAIEGKDAGSEGNRHNSRSKS